MLLTAVHIDDNEVTNDSVISHVSSLQRSTEQSKDERVNEWMLFNFKYHSVNSVPLLTYHCDFTIVTI